MVAEVAAVAEEHGAAAEVAAMPAEAEAVAVEAAVSDADRAAKASAWKNTKQI